MRSHVVGFSIVPRLAAMIGLVVGATAPAAAQDDVAEFYRGKQIRILVGTAPATGHDMITRALARHIGPRIPGSPGVIVQNVPGVGGLVMTNQLYNSGPRDGTAIGNPLSGVAMAPLLEPNAARFDAAKFNWLGRSSSEAYIAFAWHTAPVQSLEDLKHKELVVGGAGQGGSTVDFPQVASKLLGLKFKLVRGYEGSAQINHAIEKGEIQGQGGIGWGAVKAQTPHWITEKKITVLTQYGSTRDRELPDVPSLIEIATNDDDRQALKVMFARTEFGRPYFLPPDVPKARVQALRRAFDATMKDPAFIAEMAKPQADVVPMTGEEMEAMVVNLMATPAAIIARLRAALDSQAER